MYKMCVCVCACVDSRVISTYICTYMLHMSTDLECKSQQVAAYTSVIAVGYKVCGVHAVMGGRRVICINNNIIIEV